MKKFRRSFNKKESYVPECSRPHQWEADEEKVRKGNCNFPVKYLGALEVMESRGMTVCEEALDDLKNINKKVRALLWVSGDGLRVVDDDNKGLIVDQTIEKVSFCAPDRNNQRGFAYICRDGTTRRWMCHGFLAVKDTGERLSHAVGCAFGACLERKQQREKLCNVSATFNEDKTVFQKEGSFRTGTITEAAARIAQLQSRTTQADEQSTEDDLEPFQQDKPQGDALEDVNSSSSTQFEIPRRHAPASALQRQASFRGFSHLQEQTPFKRQLSLRLNDLPSTLQRQQQMHVIPEQGENYQPESISSMCHQIETGMSVMNNTINDIPLQQTAPAVPPRPISTGMKPVTDTSWISDTSASGDRTTGPPQPVINTNNTKTTFPTTTTTTASHNEVWIAGNNRTYITGGGISECPTLPNNPFQNQQSTDSQSIPLKLANINSKVSNHSKEQSKNHRSFQMHGKSLSCDSATAYSEQQAPARQASLQSRPPPFDMSQRDPHSNRLLLSSPPGEQISPKHPGEKPTLTHLAKVHDLNQMESQNLPQDSRNDFDSKWDSLASQPNPNNPFNVKTFEINL